MFSAPFTQTQKLVNWTQKTVAKLSQQSHLPTLSNALAGKTIANTRYAGVQQVPLNQIKGTASDGRSRDFTADFQLKQSHSRDRLNGVRQARQQLASLPPISLVAVGDAYYVQDGHHRVSVFHDCQQASIAAHVTVLDLG